MPVIAGALLLLQAVATQATPADSAAVARLRTSMEAQREVRVRVERNWVQLTRPKLVDTAITYHEAWFDRLELQDTVLPNPLPLARISVAQVRGKRLSFPAVVFGGLALGMSALASSLLSKAVDPANAPDNRTIVQVTLLGFGVGAVLGGAESTLTTRWVTVYRR